jgi:predicted ATPase
MISKLTLVNFKCFRRQELNLRSINVLAGTNGSGKSSVMQALILVRQSYESNNLARGRLQLNGSLIELGTAGEVYCSEPDGDTVQLLLESTNGLPPLHLVATMRDENAGAYTLQVEPQATPWPGEALFADLFNYLHAERMGPRKAFAIHTEETHPLCVGKDGANAAYIIGSELARTPVNNEALLLSSEDGRELRTIQYQWPLWMARLFPGFNSNQELISQADQVRLGIALQKRGVTGQPLFVRPPNTGFGLSYAMGIVVAGLAANPGTLLIVENPEAHLHPRAQSTMGEFLARVAAGGAQVIIETHSEHVLNGLRRTVKQGVLDPTKARILFFDAEVGKGGPIQHDIDISATGDIAKWPEGFFDQLDKDLGTLLG